ncbi:MAG: DsrE family protein [Gammaproteobacteria bacterium]|nr:DsrE family protein [Gammaproteobacteria bacterium]MCP5137003.1 DsrE family protein [Gammaproteobacteria bacterium]
MRTLPRLVVIRTLITLLFVSVASLAEESAPSIDPATQGAEVIDTAYDPPKVVFDFYFDDPSQINAALYWIRSLMNPLSAEPYGYTPDQMSIKVVIHGTEIVALAHKNYAKYQDAVERMRYYADLGVEFKVCALAAHDYGYTPADFYDFVQVVPSAITELVHWQTQGHALLQPKMMDKRFSIEEIR